MVSKVLALQGQAFVLRIELGYVQPTIHRTIVVPSRITLPKLHITIQQAMGWLGGHLHEFIINHVHYGVPDPDYPETDLQSQNRVRLDKALGSSGQFEYLYDYGDYWLHQIQVLEVMPFEGPLDSPWCLDGANACPPEDVGGEPGYMDFLQAMADSDHPDHSDLKQWYGDPFDPAAFDLQEVNERLMQIRL